MKVPTSLLLAFRPSGGTIGTGLLIASGGAIRNAGPAGAFLGYLLVGCVVYSVVLSLGEMGAYIPVPGAFNLYASRFLDPSLGFAMGWIYWFSWAITTPAELTAAALVIQYWNPNLSIGVPIAIFWVSITIFNFMPVHFYGELEFWLSFTKVITCVAFAVFSVCVIFGAGDQGFIGLKTWTSPGAFAPYKVVHQPLASFLGFWAVLIQAGFSYLGTEVVGVAAGEAADPRRSIPAACKKTFFRISFLYVGLVFLFGAQIPYTDPLLLSSVSDATASPMVIAANLAGVTHLAGLINAILLIVVVSAANSDIYVGSRLLIGLADGGFAPQFFKRTTKQGVPYIGVAFTSVFGLLGFLNMSQSGTKLLTWLINISAVAGFITWGSINASHIGFQRALHAQGISRDTLPYKVRWQPYMAWFGLIMNVVIIFTQGFTAFLPWNTTNFFAAYISLMLFLVLYVGHKLIVQPKFIDPAEADLKTGCVELDETNWDEELPKSYWAKVYDRFM